MLRNSVLVRVDDLDAQEQARVHEMVRLIPKIESRKDMPRFLAFLALVVVWIGWVITAFTLAQTDPTASFVAIMAVAMITAGLGVFGGTHSICARRQQLDVPALMDHVQHSARCRELLDAYFAAAPSFRQFLPQSAQQPQPA